MHRRGSYFDVIESCYRTDLDDNRWLAGVASAANGAIGGALGVAVLLYDGDHQGIPQRMRFAGGCDAEHAERFLARVGRDAIGSGPSHDNLIARASSYVHEACTRVQKPCVLLRSSKALRPIAHAVDAWGGARDMLVVQGFDPTGTGVWIGAPRRRRSALSVSVRDACGRLATHLAVGLRARRTIAGLALLDASEAVSSPDGRLLHAKSPAQPRALRDSLRSAVIALERARLRGRTNDDASAARQGLVEARWSLLDHFDQDGRRFVVAVKNDAALDMRALASLTERELQVVSHAALGHHNKQVAYDLGIAHATVRVLLHRAAKKLGVATRQELLERYAERVGAAPGRHAF